MINLSLKNKNFHKVFKILFLYFLHRFLVIIKLTNTLYFIFNL